jgi:hypothetical protein
MADEMAGLVKHPIGSTVITSVFENQRLLRLQTPYPCEQLPAAIFQDVLAQFFTDSHGTLAWSLLHMPDDLKRGHNANN